MLLLRILITIWNKKKDEIIIYIKLWLLIYNRVSVILSNLTEGSFLDTQNFIHSNAPYISILQCTTKEQVAYIV